MRAAGWLVSSALLLAGCSSSPYAEVSPRRPYLNGPTGPEPLASVEKTIVDAMRMERTHPLTSLGECLDAVQVASKQLQLNIDNKTALRDYNFGIGRIFQIIHDGNLDPWTKPLAVPGSHGDFTLTHRPDPRPEWNATLYDFTPADQFDVGGKGRYRANDASWNWRCHGGGRETA